MLVVSRKAEQVIYIGEDVRIVICGINGSRVKIGIDAPRGTAVSRDLPRSQLEQKPKDPKPRYRNQSNGSA